MEIIKPVMIEVSAKTDAEAKELIYAYGTNVSVEKSLGEIKKLIMKFKATGIQETNPAPNGARYIRFIINDPVHGEIGFHFDIPYIKLQIINRLGAKQYELENEAYRLVVLDLKTRLYRLGQKSRPVSVLFDRLVTRSGLPLAEFLDNGTNILGLLPPHEG